jgi:two-component system, OmpR family, sensor histidine kinase KdpD
MSSGKLKIFLGYAAGVGKTYQMLEEAQRLLAGGKDVVIGYFEPHGRKDTIAKTAGLEMLPRKIVKYRGSTFEEMDAEAVIHRNPDVAVVDEFPHTNVPGSAREKRWEDVMVLLDAGIDVLTTMNVQHLESLNDQMVQITGVKVRETIPDWVLKQADEIVMVDLTPRALLNRLERGVVYAPDKAKLALENFFKESTLVALREMALRQTAHELEGRLDQRDSAADPSTEPTEQVFSGRQKVNDAVVIYISDDPSTAMVIRRGKRVADILGATCFAVCVAASESPAITASAERQAIEKHLTFARNLHIETRVLVGTEKAQALVEFARLHKARQIFLPRLVTKGVQRLLRRSLVNEVVNLAKDMEVTIVADRNRPELPGKIVSTID